MCCQNDECAIFKGCNSYFIPWFCSLQGPPLGQRAGQTNQAKEGELPFKWNGTLCRNRGGAGPHH